MKCIYCADRRKVSKTTLEHMIDGAFIKSCFTSFESAAAARLYFDPQKPGLAPLTYLEVDQEFPNQPNQTCERWLGQASEKIYHVHLDDDDKW